jgi:hypothetical protein
MLYPVPLYFRRKEKERVTGWSIVLAVLLVSFTLKRIFISPLSTAETSKLPLPYQHEGYIK